MSIRILHSIPCALPQTTRIARITRSTRSTRSAESSAESLAEGISVLLILDSSFNPPTKAHAFLLRQALQRLQKLRPNSRRGKLVQKDGLGRNAARDQARTPAKALALGQARVLLLLSTKNADKPSAPASVKQRVEMMRCFAMSIWHDVLDGEGRLCADASATADDDDDGDEDEDGQSMMLVSGIDVGLSTEPRFLEKSVFLADPVESPYSAVMGRSNSDEETSSAENADPLPVAIPQWHLLGFDTLVRLLDGKYYEPSGSLDVLAPLFEGTGNLIFVMKRGDESNEQEDFVRRLSIEHNHGGFAGKGWNVDWSRKVELLPAFEGVLHNGKILQTSSTEVRKAAKDGDVARVLSMCDHRAADCVLQQGLYKE